MFDAEGIGAIGEEDEDIKHDDDDKTGDDDI